MASRVASVNKKKGVVWALRRYWILYLLLLPIVLHYAIFNYAPMFGVVIAFQNFRVFRGVRGSDWVGLLHFRNFFNSIFAWRVIRNTLTISLLDLAFAFPAPIILALMFNELRNPKYKRTAQTISYMPFFISTVIVVQIIFVFVGTRGPINQALAFFNLPPLRFHSNPNVFQPVFIASSIWQNVGWGSIIYLAALSAVDPQLIEAATMDGAGRFRRIWHIMLPCISPTIAILLVLRVGGLMTVGAERVFLMYNPAVFERADVIGTFVLRRGLIEGNPSFGAAVGLFNSVVNFVLLLSADRACKYIGQSGLF